MIISNLEIPKPTTPPPNPFLQNFLDFKLITNYVITILKFENMHEH